MVGGGWFWGVEGGVGAERLGFWGVLFVVVMVWVLSVVVGDGFVGCGGGGWFWGAEGFGFEGLRLRGWG